MLQGTGKLKGKIALITGADSGFGHAVALAYAREGADIAVAYLNEHTDAEVSLASAPAAKPFNAQSSPATGIHLCAMT